MSLSPRGLQMIPFALLLFVGAAQSQELRPQAPGASVSGVVTTVSGNLVTILDGTVAIDTTGAEFRSRLGEASPADVKPGIRILAVITNADAPVGTTLQAAVITLLDFPGGTLAGPVQAVDLTASTITLLSARVQVTPETRIVAGRSDSDKTLADIKAGDVVRAEVRSTDGGLVAVRIHIVPPAPDVTLTGTVKSITPVAWVITTSDATDVNVTITPETRIEGSPKVGDSVQVLGRRDAAGNLIAVAIFPARPRPAPGISLQGVVKSMGPASWVITTGEGDMTVLVNSSTRIDPSIQVGDRVEVRAVRDPAGNLVAIAIMKSRTR